jgi:hypothetical protein
MRGDAPDGEFTLHPLFYSRRKISLADVGSHVTIDDGVFANESATVAQV